MANILIVDDDPHTRRPLTKLLEFRGHAVVTAGNTIEAMGATRRHRPDLILLDVMLPPMDGLTFLMLLREGDAHWAHIPVILLTGLEDDLTRSRATELGVKEFLVKGRFTPGELMQLVELHHQTGSTGGAPSR